MRKESEKEVRKQREKKKWGKKVRKENEKVGKKVRKESEKNVRKK